MPRLEDLWVRLLQGDMYLARAARDGRSMDARPDLARQIPVGTDLSVGRNVGDTWVGLLRSAERGRPRVDLHLGELRTTAPEVLFVGAVALVPIEGQPARVF